MTASDPTLTVNPSGTPSVGRSIQVPFYLDRRHYPSLDGLRGLSILLVILSHVMRNFRGLPYFRYWEALGIMGVYMFFVLSGFLITTLLMREQAGTGKISLKDFYIRRVLRIFPLAYIYLVVLFLLDRLLGLQIPLLAYFGAAFFVANFSYFKVNWYTGHYWSLSMEEQYYLVFPFLLKKFYHIAHWLVLGLILLVAAVRAAFELGLVSKTSAAANAISEISLQCDGVLIGSLVALLCFQGMLKIERLVAYRNLVCYGGMALILLLQLEIIRLSAFNTMISSVLVGLFILVNLVASTNFWYRLLNLKGLVYIGKLSFSLYIWQQLFTFGQSKLAFLNTFPLNLVLLFGVSYCSYELYEKRFLRLKDRYSQTRKAKREEVLAGA